MSIQHFVVQITNEAILLIIFISLPAIIASLGVGLLIAIFSATTQIQEATLSFAPKMIVVYIAIAASGGWVGSLLIRFTTKCLSEFSHISVT
jgi:flagellar biosynthesis protein FliQ